MSAKNLKIGIIGGSGLDDPEIFESRKEVNSGSTPYGVPSDVLITGQINGIECVLLARHGRKHNIMPSKVNYRANIWALKNIGCTHIIASTATGSLQEHIKPGDLLVLDNFIDRTTKRMQTFYDGECDHPIGISHLQMEPPFCSRTRNVLIKTAKELGVPIHEHGTVITVEGPRFSSKAESLMFKHWGSDVINMTTVPEVILAKELGICYAAIAMATDYDCWRDCGEHVNAADVIETFKKNAIKITTILKSTVSNIAKDGDWSDTINDLKKTIEQGIMKPHD